MENVAVEKRKSVILTEEESKILRWLYLRALIPIILVILVSSTLLYFGLNSMMQRTGFTNYGLAPSGSMASASKFINTYMFVALSNTVLILVLCVIIMYIVLHDIVMPVMRITRDLKQVIDTKTKKTITIRQSDRLLKPLVDLINKNKFE
jgi:nitrogen fixation/metabolism regulation signal transduction histidine kinase